MSAYVPLDPEFVATLGRFRLNGLRDGAQNKALRLRRKGQTEEAARYEAEAKVYAAEIQRREEQRARDRRAALDQG